MSDPRDQRWMMRGRQTAASLPMNLLEEIAGTSGARMTVGVSKRRFETEWCSWMSRMIGSDEWTVEENECPWQSARKRDFRAEGVSS